MQPLIVLTTAGSADEAARLASGLVERRLAACVNIVPQIRSIYRWQEELHDDVEWLLIIKTTAERFDTIRGAIKELHSYVLPECIAVPITTGSKEYLDWLVQNSV